jgi:hypothetical protein
MYATMHARITLFDKVKQHVYALDKKGEKRMKKSQLLLTYHSLKDLPCRAMTNLYLEQTVEVGSVVRPHC